MIRKTTGEHRSRREVRPRTRVSCSAGRRWLCVGLIALPLTLTACGDVEESEEYQDLQAERDSIALDLDLVTEDLELAAQDLTMASDDLRAATKSLEASKAEAGALSTELTLATSRVESVEGALGHARNTLDKVEAAARAEAMWIMWIGPEFYDEAVRIGVPVQYADRAVARLEGPWSSWEELAGSYAAYDWGELVRQVEDPELTAAWRRWYDAEIGSDEELAAGVEVEMRLLLTILDGTEAGRVSLLSHD